MSGSNGVPALSVGLAIRNDAQGAARTIESVLAQDLTDIELVVCDNASDDDTVDTLREYAREDRRVTVAVNPVNIGSHENMNRVLELSHGTLFRWISADDWLEPGALTEAARALDHRPDAVGVTTGFTIHTPGEAPRHEQYAGEFPSSPDAARRFARMLWFFHAGDAKYDPMYGVYRRERLMRSGLIRPNERTDWLLTTELALMGPILHIDDLLAHRTKTYPAKVDRAAFRRRLDPAAGEALKTTGTSLSRDLYALARSARLTDSQLRHCRSAVRRFWLLELRRTNRNRLADAVRRVIPR
jgi:hypothetical protein